jgi:DNA polymerase (family 10)
MDNLAIARIFSEIGDLLEIKAENPFRIRAYRNGADAIVHAATRVADLSVEELLNIPGIGKDLANKIRELVETGGVAYHQELLQEFPPTILDLLRLQGVGPKTVALLYRIMNIRTLEDLEQAARTGALRSIKGMGARKEELILKALDEHKRHAGRHLMAEAADVAAALIAYLRERAPDADITPVGSLRRGCETCGDLDILAAGAAPDLMDAFVEYKMAERVLGRGETKSSVRLWGGFQADLRLVPAESRGAALQYFTGSKTHNIALRDRAIQRGFKLNEYGLFRTADDSRVAGASEEEIYAALGLAAIPPELREHRGEIAAAEADALPRLIDLSDLQGDLHMHTTTTDGRDDVEAMARAATAFGLRYIAITDHSKALAMSMGLDEARALEHARHVREVGGRIEGITLLAGIECDIRPDGTLDLADDCLAQLDFVVASVHSAFNQDEAQMTDRVLRAIESPYVDVLGHPTGRLILKRDAYKLNVDQLIAAAARSGMALEINSQVDRLDLNDVHARLARERGVPIVVSSDSHSQHGFGVLRWGIMIARRAWLTPQDVLNTRPVEGFRKALRRNRHGQGR